MRPKLSGLLITLSLSFSSIFTIFHSEPEQKKNREGGGGASPRLSGSLRLCGPGPRNQTEEKGLAQLSFIQLMSLVFVPLLLFSRPDAVRPAVETNHSLLVPSQRIHHR